MYVFVSSVDSTQMYPNNSPVDFQINLPETIAKDDGLLYMGLIDIKLPPVTGAAQVVTLFSSICDVSNVGGAKLPVVRRFLASTDPSRTYHTFPETVYVPVKARNIRHIRFYIKGVEEGSAPSFDKGTVFATFHFLRA